jgi:hypothetical protein
MGSSLDRAGGDASDKELADEEVDEERRDRRQEGRPMSTL